MSSTTAVTTQFVRRALLTAKTAIVTMAFATGHALMPNPAAAQDSTRQSRWQLIVNEGKLLPTGEMRDVLSRANLTAAKLFYSVHPAVAVTTTLGWARSRDIATEDDPKLDVFTYDVGAEVRAPQLALGGVTFRPMLGAGAGGRSYNYRSLDVDAAHNLAGYGSAAAEFGYRRARLRIEARDYVTRFKPLTGIGSSSTRNDVAVTAGVRLVAR
jgi:hypothetical protein